MYTKQALRELGMTGSVLSAGQLRGLDEDGFIIVEGVYSPADCRRMAEEFDRLHALEGERGGHEVHVEPGRPGSPTSSTRPAPTTSASSARSCWPPRITCWASSSCTG